MEILFLFIIFSIVAVSCGKILGQEFFSEGETSDFELEFSKLVFVTVTIIKQKKTSISTYRVISHLI